MVFARQHLRMLTPFPRMRIRPRYQSIRLVKTFQNKLWAVVFVSIAIVLSASIAGASFIKSRTADRYVTVKGLAEKDVEADLALWPIRFTSTSDDLNEARQLISESHDSVLEFLGRHNIPSIQVQVEDIEVLDRMAERYQGNPAHNRYVVSETLMVRSESPHTVFEASRHVGELIDAGVVLAGSSGYNQGPTYIYQGLKDIKPEMIAEATRNARAAADRFAQDSGSQPGNIRRANQGLFVILPRDRYPGAQEPRQLRKTVRVVSTVEFSL